MRKILIVEDDESIGELLRDYLEINGFYVDICMNGVEGLNSIKDGEYDLLILDIMLPGMSGYEILKRIRDDKDIPVLIVSAKKEEFDKIHGLKLGADDYITKPFSPGELVARVNAHIAKYERLKSKYGNNNTASITIRGLEIQKDSRRVFVNGKEVNLAQKEFDILLFLAQNPNRVFSREELFDRVWGLDALGDAATVTVHIGRIRDKIESEPSNPQYIETVWGAGYRLRT
ncbi:response regulator transcription factor [Acetivibrio mesophilus]|uniref:Stage 0 sporulation protein A homolog n=1 Tax=Acetivibrio mesophilus TaxID=2487273 RepID=A0A4Q0I139_9FIRM|nr:response regulator transcription factor [Acetivibrio mesophilus]ODM27866.1 DNA-binding response regulator [Clostridium sp. Bc-iso-3]RXE57898.1 DNA-binding response regulator [Acetivibrio mesophilus]HHV29972.1 response regulator transcription factor [Clostridium sp.]